MSNTQSSARDVPGLFDQWPSSLLTNDGRRRCPDCDEGEVLPYGFGDTGRFGLGCTHCSARNLQVNQGLRREVERERQSRQSAGSGPSLFAALDNEPCHHSTACGDRFLHRELRLREVRKEAERREMTALTRPEAWDETLMRDMPALEPHSILDRGDGVCLIRRGQNASVHGPWGTGKTPLIVITGIQQMRRDRLWVHLDYEMNEAFFELLRHQGVSEAEADSGLFYVPASEKPALTDDALAHLVEKALAKAQRERREVSLSTWDSYNRSARTITRNFTDLEGVHDWYERGPDRLRSMFRSAGQIVSNFVIDHSGHEDKGRPSDSHGKMDNTETHIWLEQGSAFSLAHERGVAYGIPKKIRSSHPSVEVDKRAFEQRTRILASENRSEFYLKPVEAVNQPGDSAVVIDLGSATYRKGTVEYTQDQVDHAKPIVVAALAGTSRAAPMMTSDVTGKGHEGVVRRAALEQLEVAGRVGHVPGLGGNHRGIGWFLLSGV